MSVSVSMCVYAQIISIYLDESLQTEHTYLTSNQIKKQNSISIAQRFSSWALAITSPLSKGNHYPDVQHYLLLLF